MTRQHGNQLASAVTAMVRVDVLRNFSNVVTRLGGEPDALLSDASIDPAILANRHAVIPHLSLVKLLRQSSIELSRPDFGMRLAAAQEVDEVLGPLEIAMRNSATLRAAFDYCAGNMQACSVAAQISVEEDPAQGAAFLRLDVRLAESLLDPQAVGHALLLTQQNILELSGGRIRAREIWFTHEPIASPAIYEAYFGAAVKFGQRMNGALLPIKDLDSAIPGADPQLYGLATYFIDAHYPANEVHLSARVNALIEPLLQEGRCSKNDVAGELGMSPRTLQRVLKAEGKSFESIRDEVRRNLAWRYLKHSDLPLIRIAELLGYANTSVLTKSSYRWFSASPRRTRMGE